VTTVLFLTPFDRIVARVERWLEGVDRDRDVLANTLAARGATPMDLLLLDELTRERARVLALLERLRADRHDPALLFPVRPPRVAKASLRSRPRKRLGAEQ
jgi:hypothetical protein